MEFDDQYTIEFKRQSIIFFIQNTLHSFSLYSPIKDKTDYSYYDPAHK